MKKYKCVLLKEINIDLSKDLSVWVKLEWDNFTNYIVRAAYNKKRDGLCVSGSLIARKDNMNLKDAQAFYRRMITNENKGAIKSVETIFKTFEEHKEKVGK